jgi:chromosome segregation ATPase
MGYDSKTQFNLKNLSNLQLDIRTHQGILADLIDQEKIASHKLAEAAQSISSVEQKKLDLEDQIKLMGEEIQNLILFASDVMKSSLESVRQSNQILDKHVEVINKLAEKVDIAKQDINQLIENKKQIHQEILEEHKKLSIRKSDLDVYQGRIEAEYAKLLPDEPILL